MASEKSPAQVYFDLVVKSAVTDVMKPLGFRKSTLNFHRRHGEVVQVVNFQSSHGSCWSEKLFYVNVGLAFDSICRLTATEILEKPKEYDCDARGTRDRLEKLIDGVPDRWAILAGVHPHLVLQELKTAMERLADDLQSLDCVQAYRNHRWFDRNRAIPTQVNAQILYVLGDLDGAWNEVQHLCKFFSDRRNINVPRWWIEKLGLTALASRLSEST